MTPSDLDELERAVLEKLVAGDLALLRRLQRQVEVCRVRERDKTGVGVFSSLDVDPEAAPSIEKSVKFGDVVADIAGLEHGAGFLLMIKDGYLDVLEAYTYDEPWPESVTSFALSYRSEPRNLTAFE